MDTNENIENNIEEESINNEINSADAEIKTETTKNHSHKAKYNFDDEQEILYQEQLTHPYYDAEPDLGRSKYEPSPMLTRGCVNVPQSYIPVEKSELERNSKLSVHNWMSEIKPPFSENMFDCVEVRFKNSKKDFFRILECLDIVEGDVVAVEGSPGHDIGIVTLVGELCKVQMKKKKVDYKSPTIKKLYRRAKATDIEKWLQSMDKEDSTLFRTRAIVDELGIKMKINDIEYQGDGAKAIFYYTADERVDFRLLIKRLADEFRVRIEMKQIGARQEASRLGGIATCGREFCCSSWLNCFNSVSTSVARAQQIFPNPQKLAGQCGKLKCCLNFEYDVYIDELKSFPEIGVPLHTKKGKALYVKTDVFRRLMWYNYENTSDFIILSADSVKEIIKKNRSRETVMCLEDYQVKLESNTKTNN